MAIVNKGATKGSLLSPSARLIFRRNRSLLVQPVLIVIVLGLLLTYIGNHKLDKIEAFHKKEQERHNGKLTNRYKKIIEKSFN